MTECNGDVKSNGHKRKPQHGVSQRNRNTKATLQNDPKTVVFCLQAKIELAKMGGIEGQQAIRKLAHENLVTFLHVQCVKWENFTGISLEKLAHFEQMFSVNVTVYTQNENTGAISMVRRSLGYFNKQSNINLLQIGPVFT